MKRSRIFTKPKGMPYFDSANSNGLCVESMLEYWGVVIPKTAKKLELVCTLKKGEHSTKLTGKAYHVLAGDFKDDELPTKEKFFHIEWW